jgi:IS5 family transposase
VLPKEALVMPPELARVDKLLDDPAFLEPFRALFDPQYGRRSVPMETFLRLMFLKYRYRLGFEALCREVSDSVSWCRFCRVPLGGAVPDHSTLKKLAKRAGPLTIEALNQALVKKADEHKVLKMDRARADTTVVPANVGYPTDSGLMARGVARLVTLVAALHLSGLAPRTRLRDRRRAMRRRAHAIGAWLRRRTEVARDEAKAITAQMVVITEAALVEAALVATNAKRGLRKAGGGASGKTVATLAELELVVERLGRVLTQTRLRLAGDMPDGSGRLVSLHDPDARPIKKGRIGKPVEFGYLAQVLDNSDGVVLDHSVHVGNPADGPLLAPAIARLKGLVGRVPKNLTADRGYGDAQVDQDLKAAGVSYVAIVRKGKPTRQRAEEERRPKFVKLIKWRTGCEARVSTLKRGYGWGRSWADGIDGTRTWCGYGVFAHNAVKISGLIEARELKTKLVPSTPASRRPPGRSSPPPKLPSAA